MKSLYRESEHGLQSAEALATIASLHGGYTYPAQSLYEAWVLMFLNTDRNTLWGSAGGMVFVNAESWDVQDRFAWVTKTANEVQQSAASALADTTDGTVLFNPLNWRRSDPVALTLPKGSSVAGSVCEALPDGRVLCLPTTESMSATPLKLVKHMPE